MKKLILAILVLLLVGCAVVGDEPINLYKPDGYVVINLSGNVTVERFYDSQTGTTCYIAQSNTTSYPLAISCVK